MPLPEDLALPEYTEAIALLDEVRAEIERGEIMSLLVLAERSDGKLQGRCTSTHNVYAIAGYALQWALLRMGFLREERHED